MRDKAIRYEKPTWPSDERAGMTSGDGPRQATIAVPVAVPVSGTYLVVDGRVMKASVDTPNYAGPCVHLITTDEELGETE